MLPPPTPGVLSPSAILVDGRLPRTPSRLRKIALLAVFCLAQFVDSFNNSALFSAIPSLDVALGMSQGQSTWLISAFQLTFASFLLMSGKISDLYSAKGAFVTGLAGQGLICLGAGFAKDKITLIILRALTGIAASMTIPSALTLLVNTFPEPNEQSRAIGIFGGTGAVANILGLIIGAIFTEYASYHWVFYFVALVATPVALLCLFILPPRSASVNYYDIRGDTRAAKFRKLDLPGVSLLTVALILFIFSLTSGSTSQWASPMVITPLIISVALIGVFLYWETKVKEGEAAVPPRTWFLPNFAVLFAVALLPYFWFTTVFAIYTTLWQSVYGWPVIESAIHMIPIGVTSFSTSFTGPLARRISPKYLLLAGQAFLVIATTLLALADTADKYWSHVFPGLVLGSVGAMLTNTHTNIAIFRTSPSHLAGTIGAIFNGALQLGSAVGIAVVTSIQTSVQAQEGAGGFDRYDGRAAAFWFVLGVVCVEALAIAVFYKVEGPGVRVAAQGKAGESKVGTDAGEKVGEEIKLGVDGKEYNQDRDIHALPMLEKIQTTCMINEGSRSQEVEEV